MVSKQSVEEQIKRLGFKLNSWGRAEIRELPHILLPGEEIYELVNGMYEGGFALAIATDVRLLLVDKKPMNFLTVEDIRFDMISEIDYSHRLLGAQINISTGYKDLSFRSYNQKRLRKLIGHVQHCMAEAKRQQSQSQAGQNQHLERINQQLQTYLEAQSQYQLQIQQRSQKTEAGDHDVPVPQKPAASHELSDYLFAKSLLAQYEAQTGKKLETEDRLSSEQQPELVTTPEASSNAPAPNKQHELHDLWSAGMQEVFGKHLHGHIGSVVQVPTIHNSFEINPVSVVFSRLPMLIRSRKFSQTLKPLSSKSMAS